MNFLGIGPFELLLILVIATIVLGPERMAQTGRMLGQLYAQYRTRWQRDVDEMTRELRRELEVLQDEMNEIRQTAESEFKAAQNAFQDVIDSDLDLEGTDKQPETARSSTESSIEPASATDPQDESGEADSEQVDQAEDES
jgi:Tat protein translocase TatB subunit